MDITDIRVFPVDEEKLKAFVTVVFDHCFVVCDIKVIHGNNGLFISMPSKRRKNGTFRDIAHPLNSETRRMIEERILSAYEEALAAGVEPRNLRRPREAEEPAARSDSLRGEEAPSPLPGGRAHPGAEL